MRNADLNVEVLLFVDNDRLGKSESGVVHRCPAAAHRRRPDAGARGAEKEARRQLNHGLVANDKRGDSVVNQSGDQMIAAVGSEDLLRKGPELFLEAGEIDVDLRSGGSGGPAGFPERSRDSVGKHRGQIAEHHLHSVDRESSRSRQKGRVGFECLFAFRMCEEPEDASGLHLSQLFPRLQADGVVDRKMHSFLDAATTSHVSLQKRIGFHASRLLLVTAVLSLSVSTAFAAVLTDAATKAYAEYVDRARRAFLDRVTQPVARGETERAALQKEETPVQAGGGDGIQEMPNSLIHHWRGRVFIPRTTLSQALSVSRAYNDYPTIFRPVVAAKVLSDEGDALRVQFRMRQSAGGITGTLDMWSTIRYSNIDPAHAYVISVADTIREVKDADKSTERYVSAGEDRGYLWRAATFTRFVEGDGGVYMEMETIGLSRPFPALLGWVIEPIARRIGRGSVENSVQEFRRAVLMRHV